MSISITISLQEHVYRLALRRAKLVYGNNFSSYINTLICKDFKEEELIKELNELRKPLWTGKKKIAEMQTTCQVCGLKNNIDQLIYETNLICEKDYQKWVHENCCRKEE